MLILVTGVPGAGKTAGAIDLLTREFKDRPLFADGVNGLQLDHLPVDVLKWHDDVPDGAVVVVDEVQRKWRPLGPGRPVPPSIAALETHRHRGLDFILITQNPKLLHANVRALIGRHLHIRDTGFAGRWLYEWPECNVDLAWRSCPNKRRYKLPRRVFDLYKSASMHNKPVRNVPALLYILGAVVVALLVLAWVLWGRVGGMFNDEPAADEQLDMVPALLTEAPRPEPVRFDEETRRAGPPDERIDFVPRVIDRPWTAPAYDEQRKVVHMPRIGGGVCFRGECVCFAHTGERLPDVGHDACAKWIEAPPFDPYYIREKPTASAPVKLSGRVDAGDGGA